MNLYEPSAEVIHVGSASSGSRYNVFKTKYSSRNNVYLIYKNMPLFADPSEQSLPFGRICSKNGIFLPERSGKGICKGTGFRCENVPEGK